MEHHSVFHYMILGEKTAISEGNFCRESLFCSIEEHSEQGDQIRGDQIGGDQIIKHVRLPLHDQTHQVWLSKMKYWQQCPPKVYLSFYALTLT